MGCFLSYCCWFSSLFYWGSILYFIGNKLPFLIRGILGGVIIGGIASFWISGWDLIAIIAAGAIASMISIIHILGGLFSILSNVRGGGRFGGGGGSSGW